MLPDSDSAKRKMVVDLRPANVNSGRKPSTIGISAGGACAESSLMGSNASSGVPR
jgi:hypothetical protein